MKSGKLLIVVGFILFNTNYVFSNPSNFSKANETSFRLIVSNSITDVTPPTAPSNLQSANITQTSVDLYWNASTDDVGVAGYKIYQNGTLIKTVSGTTTSTNIGGLSKSTGYNFTVRAFDYSDNLSGESDVEYVLTQGTNDISGPSAPKNLKAVKVTIKEIIIEWGASTDNSAVEKYQVYVNGSLFGSTQTTSMLIYGLLPGTNYSIEVKAFDNFGNSSLSSQITVATLSFNDTQAPSTPSLSYSINGTNLTLQWNSIFDNIGVASVQIFRNDVLIQTVDGTKSNVAIGGLENDKLYSFYIKAVDYSGNISTQSNTINIYINSNPDTEPPTMPSNLSVGVEKNNITLQWSASADNVSVLKYGIYIIDYSTSNFYYYETTSTSYFFQGLNSGTFYGFYVGATDPSGNFSGWSYISASTDGTVDKTPPSPPSNLVAKSVTFTEIVISWDASVDDVGVDKYRVFVDGAFYSEVKGTAASISGLTPGTYYTIEVQASDFAGNYSNISNSITIQTNSDIDIIAPSSPTNLQASAVGQTDVLLEWNRSTDNIGVHHYNIYKDDELVATSTGAGIVINKLLQNTQYSFYVTAQDDAGNVSSKSLTITIKTKGVSVYKNYCTSKSNNSSDEWIDFFGIGTISNASGSTTYSNFLKKFEPVQLYPSTTYTLYGSIGYSGYTYSEYIRFWIDYNRDGDFDDAGELIGSGGPLTTPDILSGSFSTPADFVEGYTVLRVSLKYNAYPSPCEIFSWGEVEDYPILLSKSKSANNQPGLYIANTHDLNIPDEEQFAVFPNPANDEITITDLKANEDISIYNLMGKHIKTIKCNGDTRKIDISDLKTGSYLIKMNVGSRVITKQFIKK